MTLTIPDDVVFRDFSGQTVLLNLATGTYFGLDEVGSRMWVLLSEHRSTDRVVTELLKEYDAGAERIRGDLDQLVRQLSDRGLVKLHG